MTAKEINKNMKAYAKYYRKVLENEGISKCMYVEMFAAYGIRPLCKIFCNTDRIAYASLPRHVNYIRHSDLSDGPACHDEIIKK